MTEARVRPTGRRAGDSGTRDAILDAALRLFAEHGYDGASIRAIAGAAGVDPALVRHFFGDKDALFTTAVAQRTTIVQRLADALAGDDALAGRRVARTYLELWEAPATRPVLLALARSATTSPRAAGMLAEIIGGRILPPHDDMTGPAVRRIALAGSHLLGLAMARHVLALPPLSAPSLDELVDAVAPTIQRYLTGTAG